jgi:WD40 repeat protein
VADIFVSYSRTDQAFVRDLHAAMLERGREAWVDWEDIPPTAQWMETIFTAIDESDAFVFVISPRALLSRVCAVELAHAVEGGKRLIPLLRHAVEDDQLPESLASLQWIDARDGLSPDVVLDGLLRALDTDLEWVRTHTRLLTQAREWEQSGRQRGRVLRRSQLRAAEAWLSAAPAIGDTHPTELQIAFIQASRRAATRNVTALGAIAIAVAIGATVLAVAALLERNSARSASRIALSRELAARSVSQLDVDPELAVLLAERAARVAATPESTLALRRALETDRLLRALRPRAGFTPVALSPDDRYAVATPEDSRPELWKTVKLLDARTGRTLHDLSTGGAYYYSAAFSRDSTHVIVGGAGDSRAWTVPGARLVLQRMPALAFWFTPDATRVAIGVGSSMSVWRTADATQIRALGDVQPIDGFALDSAGARAVSIDTRGAVYVWDTGTTKRLARYPYRIGHQWDTAVFSSKGALAMGSIDGSVGLLPALDAKPVTLAPPALHDRLAAAGVAALAFSPDGTRLAVAQGDGTASVWRVGDHSLQVELPKTSPYLDIAYSPDGRSLVTASSDGTARIFDAISGAERNVLRGHAGPVREARFDPTGQLVYTRGDDGIRTWNVAPTHLTLLRGMRGDVAAEFAPDQREIVASDFDTTRVFRLSGALEKRLTGHIPNDGAIADASPDDNSIANVSSDGRVILYTRASGWRGRRLRYPGHGQAIDVRFSADGKRLIAVFALRTDIYALPSGRRIGAVANWPSSYSDDLSMGIMTPGDKPAVVDLPSGTVRLRLPGAGKAVLSPDGTIAAAAQGAEVHILGVAGGHERSTLNAPAKVSGMKFSADGSRLLTTQVDGSVGLWSTADGHPDALFVSHAGTPSVTAFNADGSLVALGGLSGTVSLFDAATGVALEQFGTGRSDSISSLSFGGPRDDIILAGHVQDGTATLVPCPICRRLPGLVQLAQDRVTRSLTTVERRRYLHER